VNVTLIACPGEIFRYRGSVTASYWSEPRGTPTMSMSLSGPITASLSMSQESTISSSQSSQLSSSSSSLPAAYFARSTTAMAMSISNSNSLQLGAPPEPRSRVRLRGKTPRFSQPCQASPAQPMAASSAAMFPRSSSISPPAAKRRRLDHEAAAAQDVCSPLPFQQLRIRGKCRPSDIPTKASHNRRRRIRSKQQDPFEASEVQPVLYVWTPQGAQHCAGRYELVTGRRVNGWPLWKMCAGSYWLYSGRGGGHWCIGAHDVQMGNFACNAGFILSEKPHGGMMPDQITRWNRWDHDSEGHLPDCAVQVSRIGPNVTKVLYVTCEDHHSEVCAGQYDIVGNSGDCAYANGWPIWKMRGGDYWMYSCKDGCWGICAKDVRARGFDCCAGFIISVEAHCGAMPDTVGRWERFDEGEGSFMPDNGVAVSAQPPDGCWRLSSGYCGHPLCRAAHDGDLLALQTQLTSGLLPAFEQTCKVTGNDPLSEAAAEGQTGAVEALLLAGFCPNSAWRRCIPPRFNLSDARRWRGEPTIWGDQDDHATRYFYETLDRLRWRNTALMRCRLCSKGTFHGGFLWSSGKPAGQNQQLPPAVFDLILDFVAARPSGRSKNPESLQTIRMLYRHVVRHPELRRWLPHLKTASPRWHQLLRNWDYFLEEIFFRCQATRSELEMDLCNAGVFTDRGCVPRNVGRSVLVESCADLIVNGVSWPPKTNLQVIPHAICMLQALRNKQKVTRLATFGPCDGRVFFVSLPEECYQRLLDFLIHRRGVGDLTLQNHRTVPSTPKPSGRSAASVTTTLSPWPYLLSE